MSEETMSENNEPMEMHYPSDDEPIYIKDDQGHGFCPECGSALIMGGAVSYGDGDLGDKIECMNCGYSEQINVRWFDNFGNKFDSEEEMWIYGDFEDDPHMDDEP